MLRLSLHRRRQLLPWIFLGPGLAWLVVFFAIPLVNQLNVSLQTGDPETGYVFNWAFSTYADAIRDYHQQFIRSVGYAAAATVLDFVIAFPLAYFIAFKAGRWKNVMLLLIILPFFVSYVLRTVGWQLMPWIFLGPGLAWRVVFFAIPLVNQLNVSLQTGDPETGYVFNWAFSTYTDAISDYSEQFLRSIGYAAAATVLTFVIAFPLAYFIAFKAGRWKNVMLLLIILPFFVSYVLRTVSWQLILADDGFVVDTLKTIGPAGGRRRGGATA